MNYKPIYTFKNDQPRRIGLTKASVGPSQNLLRIGTNVRITAQPKMPPKTTRRANEVKQELTTKEKENFLRPPESSSEEEDNSADIQKTNFRSGPAKLEEKAKNEGTRGRKGKSSADEDGPKTSDVVATTKGKGKPARAKPPLSSSQSKISPKRKNDALGKGMLDEHGRVAKKSKKLKTFGSSQSSSKRNSLQFKAPATISSDNEDDSPKKPFKAMLIVESSENSEVDSGSSFNTSHKGSPGSNRGFKRPKMPSPEKNKSKSGKQTKSSHEMEDDEPGFKIPSSYNYSDSLDASENEEFQQPAVPIFLEEKYPATQRPAFKAYNFDDSDDLLKTAQTMIGSQDKTAFVPTLIDDDSLLDSSFKDVSPIIERSCCPMCNQLVDPADLKAYGKMNTREQEKFCRSHQRKDAQTEWSEKQYPAINWDMLDSRISKHHAFVRRLINGEDSHYRSLLSERINAGKDRSLLKMTSNLIPGYYGARGLRIISENIMREFTPLLKERMVVDRLMSSRGFTPYVQLAIVPEVTVLLIMEDMGVETAEARGILEESVGVGELLNEEIREVVARRVEDSEEDEDD